jgi:uncharacterized radical SAM superfamily Fe-S cluster-containing enzyme
MIDNKEAAEKYAKELCKDMLLAIEWNKVDLVQEKRNAKNCAVVAINNIITATTNFDNPTGIVQNQFYIDVLHFLENYEI